MKRWLLRLGVGIVVAGLVVQLVPYGRDHDNPAVVSDAPWPSPAARRLAMAACYDCHSNETEWPWYSNVAPMSWLVQHDVDEGREHLNFSRWPPVGEIDELHDVVEEGEMPPRQYRLAHPAARLDDREKAELVAALRELESSVGDGEAGGDGSGRGPRGDGGGD